MRLIVYTSMFVGLVLGCTGCPGDDGAGSGDGTGTSAGTVSDSGPGPTSVASVDGSGTGVGLCGDVADEEVGPAVSIQIVNTRAEGVWLPLQNFCYFSVPYTFTGPDGAGVAWVGPDCGTCQSYAQGNCACPGAACSEDVLLYLDPGAVLEGAWSGGQFMGDTLPDACPGLDQCGASCSRAVQAPGGSYMLEVQAGSSASGCVVEPCACDPFEGRCTVFDAMAVVDEPQRYFAAFDYPTTTSVEITIE